MKLSTIATAGLFVISTGLFAYSSIVTNNNLDTSGPEITMTEDTITVSVQDGDDVILAGITARDSRDGDVTDSLVVESISNFIDSNTRQASIVAFDQDNHIARTIRTIQYTDYTSPQFALSEPLQFRMDTYDFVSNMTATDCLDGDITSKIHLTYDEEYQNGQEELKVTYSVSNSEGDVSTLPVTITFYDAAEESTRPVIELTDYLIYITSGESVDPMDYLSSISVYGAQYKNRNGSMMRTGNVPEDESEYISDSMLSIHNPVSSTPGTYEIEYTVKDPRDPEDDQDDSEKTVRLIVVVTEE